MYGIEKHGDYLLVRFEEDFNNNDVRLVLNQLLQPRCARQDIVWLVGPHRYQVSMGELQLIVDEYGASCSMPARQRRCVFVVEPGLTAAYIDLLARHLSMAMPFSYQVVQSLEAAEAWLEAEKRLTA